MFGIDEHSADIGMASLKDVEALNKALTAGQDINNPGSSAGEGFPLRVESLESTLKVTTYKMEQIVFWKSLTKIPAYNTVEEYNTLSSYGQNDDSLFVAENQTPESEDSTYARNYAIVKYMGTRREVTHVMQQVRPAHGNVIAQETVNGTMHLLKGIEKGLFFADSSLCALQFDGYHKLIADNAPSTNVIDLRGGYLTEDLLCDSANVIFDAPNYGLPNELYLNPKVKADLAKTFFPKERHNTFDDKSGVIGANITGFEGPTGIIKLKGDVFIQDGGGPNVAAVGDVTKIPGTPVPTSLAPGADPTAQFTVDDIGDYFYYVVACNRYGRSISVNCGSGNAAVAVSSGESVTVVVTPSTSAGAGATEWYELYRSPKNGAVTTTRLIQRIANSEGTGDQTLTDKNETLPGTTTAMMVQNDPEVMAVKQLSPMIKIPLAIVSPAIRWMQLIYLVPVLYIPGRTVLFKNIGRLTSSYTD